ncbi:MAG: Creatinase/aminopeptidase [Rhodospirillales bacterium]|nr:Creatinase/aminopeptidase [Rhodospirillales bacterium]
MTPESEDHRAAGLLAAQNSALALFREIERGLLRPGITERELSREIHELAAAMFGVKAHWHKRVIRSGANTLMPYNESPPNLTIQEDDILFVDLGPVFEAWEADFGRTYVLGNDPAKLRLRDDLELIFNKAKAHFKAHPDITGAELYNVAIGLAEEAGWRFGGSIAGHLVGEFPHERALGAKVSSHIAPGNREPIGGLDSKGRKRHWILEIHLVDHACQIGGFYEQLLTVG